MPARAEPALGPLGPQGLLAAVGVGGSRSPWSAAYNGRARANWRRWAVQRVVCARDLAAPNAGNSSPASTPSTASTVKSSIRVKAARGPAGCEQGARAGAALRWTPDFRHTVLASASTGEHKGWFMVLPVRPHRPPNLTRRQRGTPALGHPQSPTGDSWPTDFGLFDSGLPSHPAHRKFTCRHTSTRCSTPNTPTTAHRPHHRPEPRAASLPYSLPAPLPSRQAGQRPVGPGERFASPRRVGNPRYSRPEVCATTPRARAPDSTNTRLRPSASGLRHPASGIRHPASGIRYLVSGIWHPASAFSLLTPRF
jgi:hypothetical protein